MSKRFTDTRKWRDPWFRSLTPRQKLLWLYLCDECDLAGVWDKDLELASFSIGTKITDEDMEKSFDGRLLNISETKILISGFIRFQYGEVEPGSKISIGINRVLTKYSLSLEGIDTLSIPYTRGMHSHKDKDKDQDKDKDNDLTQCALDFDSIYRLYPRKEGKSAGLAKARAQISNAADFELLRQAITKYAAYCRAENKETKYIKHFSTFMSGWRDWLDQDAGTVVTAAQQPLKVMPSVDPEERRRRLIAGQR